MSEEHDGWEDWLRSAAREHYHPPEETPREELWRAVRREREEREGGGREAAASDGGWKVPRWARRAAALAAVLAVGVVLGRGSVGPLMSPSQDSPSQATSTVDSRPASESLRAGGAPAARAPSVSPAMRRTTRQVLNRAEVLLTGFRSAAAGAGTDRQTARWARDVLTTTRLLLDSPAARDPATRELLEDLEIVLAQLAALPDDSAASRAEAEIVSRGIEERDVLSRIRMLDERRSALDR